MMTKAILAWVVLGIGCATVRPITYPSPCRDRGESVFCKVMGYEVWGSRSQIQAQAKACSDSAHVTIDPHGDYGVVRCFTPDVESRESVAIVVVEPSEPPPDMVVSLDEAEAQAPMKATEFEAPDAEPSAEIQVQPPSPKPLKAKRSKRVRRRNLDD